MGAQLLDRYMEGNCRHGLYLVVWLNCPQWDRKDPRWKQASTLELDEVTKQLDAQAGQLSRESGARLTCFILNAALS